MNNCQRCEAVPADNTCHACYMKESHRGDMWQARAEKIESERDHFRRVSNDLASQITALTKEMDALKAGKLEVCERECDIAPGLRCHIAALKKELDEARNSLDLAEWNRKKAVEQWQQAESALAVEHQKVVDQLSYIQELGAKLSAPGKEDRCGECGGGRRVPDMSEGRIVKWKPCPECAPGKEDSRG